MPNTPPIDPAAVWAQILAQDAARAAIFAETLPTSKAALFDALDAASIGHVVVVFDGIGDSGQISRVDAVRDGEIVALPSVDIEVTTARWDGSGVDREFRPIADAVESLAYALLAESHGGWENNDGAFGAFRFDVASRTIGLDYCERLETSQYHGHSW